MPLEPLLVAAGMHGCPIPSRMLASVEDPDLIAALVARRQADPATFGTTAPHAGPLRLPAEFEPKSELHLVFPGWLDHEDLFQDLVEATWTEGEVHVHLMQLLSLSWSLLLLHLLVPTGELDGLEVLAERAAQAERGGRRGEARDGGRGDDVRLGLHEAT